MYCWLKDEVSINAWTKFYPLTIYRFYFIITQSLPYSYSRQTIATSSRQTIATSSWQTIANSSRQTIANSTILSRQNNAKISTRFPINASTSGSTSSSPTFTQLSTH